MKEPIWLNKHHILNFHAKQIREHGGLYGIRDLGLLESAVNRPKHFFHYDDKSSIHQLASAYSHGIIRNHPFIDGNKRTGLITGGVFLILNGFSLEVTEPELVVVISELAAGKITEQHLSEWFADNSRSLKK